VRNDGEQANRGHDACDDNGAKQPFALLPSRRDLPSFAKLTSLARITPVHAASMFGQNASGCTDPRTLTGDPAEQRTSGF
jgi:hypothetical protein